MLKNATIYRMPAGWSMTAAELTKWLEPQRFLGITALETKAQGWVPVIENGELVHTVNRQILLRLQFESKVLPMKVINRVTKDRAAELAEQQGFPPGRKQTKELKEQVTDELLPRAFSDLGSMLVWIDPVNGWLVVDTSSASKAEDVLKMLFKAIPGFPLETLRTTMSPAAAMTDWLASDEAPYGFTVDQDAELRSTGEGKATVRYIRHTLDVDDTRKHIEAGKQCTSLAMTWKDKISFTLSATMAVKKITLLDVLKEDADLMGRDERERFDGGVLLATSELSAMFSGLVEALGGFLREKEVAHG